MATARHLVRLLTIALPIAIGCAPVFAQVAAVTVAHSFMHLPGSPEGSGPGGLTLASDANLYGTTVSGGLYGGGTVFKLAPDGVLTTLHSFKGSDGLYPDSCLVPAMDGGLYGTTGQERYQASPTVFRITPEGQFKTVYILPSPRDGAGFAVIVKARDGRAYSTNNWERESFRIFGDRRFVESWPDFQILPATAVATTVQISTARTKPAAVSAPGDEPICGLNVASSDGHVWGSGSPGNFSGMKRTSTEDPFGHWVAAVATYLMNGTEYVRIKGQAVENQDVRFANSAYGRFAQDASGDILATTQLQENGRQHFAIVRVTRDGKASEALSLDSLLGEPVAAKPVLGLVNGGDGYFYGLAQGYPPAYNIVFRFKLSTTPELVYRFSGADCAARLDNPLTPTGAGGFYLTTRDGGDSKDGSIFRLMAKPH